MEDEKLHIAMYPWFAMGHITPFLYISNKLAERGHSISFLLPKNTQPKIEHLNLHKDLITFIPITVPCVDGLPPGAETTKDVPPPLVHLLMKAMDLTEPIIGSILRNIKPHIVFFDFTHWLPPLARKLGIVCMDFIIVSPASIGYVMRDKILTEAELLQPPQGFPPSKIKVSTHEARGIVAGMVNGSSGIPFMERLLVSLSECDAVVFKTCREIEGAYCDYVESRFEKPVILAGPVLPEPPNSVLEEEIEMWLSKFKAKSVIFCALGSECVLKKEQFQELVLGFELTGFPFFAALKPPMEGHDDKIESALPQGFEERVKGRGFVHGGWIQQLLILKHPSVGCFVTHCGSGSLSEAMVNECQLVLLPINLDHFINARMMGEDLKVGVEIERGYEDGLFTRDGVCKAVKTVMMDDDDSDDEVGKEMRQNHAKIRHILTSPGFENAYVDGFVNELHHLVELK